jgi:hypothetical protein
MSDQPIRSSVRTFVLRDGGLPLEERTIELGLERHVAPAADAITDKGPISAWVESVGL